MRVRPATIDDKERFAELGYDMHQESDNFRDMDYDFDKVERLIDYSLQDDPFFFVSVVEDDAGKVQGLMAGTCYPAFFGEDKVASDLALYISPNYRGLKVASQLLDSFITWAKEQGAVVLNIGTTAGIVDDRYMSFLQKFGFKKIGFIARKEL